MSYKEEFLLQWKNYISVVESSIIKQIKVNKKVSIKDLNHIINSEKEKWFSSTQYQGIWLNKIKSEDSNIAKKFEEVLMKVEITQVIPTSTPSFIPYLLIVCLATAASYLLTSYMQLSLWKVLGATMMVPIVLAGSMLTLWNEKNIKIQMNHRRLYLSQLDSSKEQLLKLCEMLDDRSI